MTFIDTLRIFAQRHGKAGNVLPELIIAQGILESDSGTSELAVKANNLFGIKKGSGWTGEVYRKESSEWSKEKGWYTAFSDFRKYPSFEQAVADLVEKYNTMPRYSAVLGETDFVNAAYAVFNAGYATDPNYPLKLIKIFEQYNLQDLTEDVAPEKGEEAEMAVKVITVEAGHAGFGVTPGKRGPDGKYEWIWNNQVLLAFVAYIEENFTDIKVYRVDDSTGRTDVSLNTRTARANARKSDLHISFHHNAMSTRWFSGAGGVETYVMTPKSANPGSMAAAEQIHPRVVKAMGLRDRGIKAANFAVLRQTNMPAVLIEGGFMDSRTDRRAMDNPAKTKAQGEAAAEGAGIYLKGTRRTGHVSRPTPAKDYYGPGDTGTGVAAVQTDLVAVGFDIAIDGSYGPATEKAVRAFQEKYGLQVDGYFGPASQSKMASLIKAQSVKPEKWYRVRKSWGDVESQLGAFGEFDDDVKALADKNPGYEVYDDDGKVIYPKPKPAPKPTQKWYRVRDEWEDEAGQIAAFPEPDSLDGAKEMADKHKDKGYKVFDDSGKVVYDPKPVIDWPDYPMGELDRLGEVELTKDTAYRRLPDNVSPNIYNLKAGHKCHFYEVRGDFYRLGAGWVYKGTLKVTKWYYTGEYDKMDGLIVIHSDRDSEAALKIQKRTNYPILLESSFKEHTVRHIIKVGGKAEGFDKKSKDFTLLSGESMDDTIQAVEDYIK